MVIQNFIKGLGRAGLAGGLIMLLACLGAEAAEVGPLKLIDRPEALVLMPEGFPEGARPTVVFVFSPSGDARGMIRQWRPLSEKHRLIVVASKEYRNHMPDLPQKLAVIHDHLQGILQSLPGQRHRVILTGMSGGGSFSHALSIRYPGFADALIINTGRIWTPHYAEAYHARADLAERYRQSGAARLAVFLMSPTDFRYEEMKRDQKMLAALGWQVHPIEFPGGHQVAPQAVYESALSWIVSQPAWNC